MWPVLKIKSKMDLSVYELRQVTKSTAHEKISPINNRANILLTNLYDNLGSAI
jgi:hypothetical protein